MTRRGRTAEEAVHAKVLGVPGNLSEQRRNACSIEHSVLPVLDHRYSRFIWIKVQLVADQKAIAEKQRPAFLSYKVASVLKYQQMCRRHCAPLPRRISRERASSNLFGVTTSYEQGQLSRFHRILFGEAIRSGIENLYGRTNKGMERQSP